MAFMAPLMPFLSAAGAAVSGISSMQNSNYQAQVASNNAKLLETQAERETFAANEDMKDQDTAARGQVAELMSQMDASGLNSNRGTMLFRRAGAESLATRDRERLKTKRDIQLENTKRQASGQRAEAKANKRAGKLGLLTSLLNIPSSYMSSAATLNDNRRNQMSLSNPSYES